MSLLQFKGIGEVTALKQTNTGEITVYLSAANPFGDGEVVADAEHKQQVTKTAKGDEKTSNVLESSNLPAVWFNLGCPNRITPPDVAKGSTVALYQIGGQDLLRWTTYGVDTTNMSLETVVYGFSANPNRDINKPFNYDDYYVFEISTRTGSVSLRTSMSNGEACRYEVKLDTMKGLLLLADSLHNAGGINSREHHIFFTNEEQSLFEINKDNISAICKNNMLLNAEQLLALKAKQIMLECQTFGLESNTWSIKGEGTVDGNVSFLKGISVAGKATGKGGSPFQVNDLKTDAVVSYNGHKHRETNSITTEPIG